MSTTKTTATAGTPAKETTTEKTTTIVEDVK
jgi:hypothetical protein